MPLLFEFCLKGESESFFGCLGVFFLSVSIFPSALLSSPFTVCVWGVGATRTGNWSSRSQIREAGGASCVDSCCPQLSSPSPGSPPHWKALEWGALDQPPRLLCASEQQLQHLVSGMIGSQTFLYPRYLPSLTCVFTSAPNFSELVLKILEGNWSPLAV